jgi:D-serine deaminase-like pyridoxal phosphate-dependent protein
VLGRVGALLLVAIVAFTPRAGGAQTAGSPLQTVRHTLVGQVPIVTQTAISSHSRPGVALMRDRLGDVATAQLAQRAWIATVDVRSNVSARLVVDAGAPGPNWQILDAGGQLVSWSGERVELSATRAAGRYVVDVIWIAPDVTTPPPPTALLRLEPASPL